MLIYQAYVGLDFNRSEYISFWCETKF